MKRKYGIPLIIFGTFLLGGGILISLFYSVPLGIICMGLGALSALWGLLSGARLKQPTDTYTLQSIKVTIDKITNGDKLDYNIVSHINNEEIQQQVWDIIQQNKDNRDEIVDVLFEYWEALKNV